MGWSVNVDYVHLAVATCHEPSCRMQSDPMSDERAEAAAAHHRQLHDAFWTYCNEAWEQNKSPVSFGDWLVGRGHAVWP